MTTETVREKADSGCPHFRNPEDCEDCWRDADNAAEIADLVRQADAAVRTAELAVRRTWTAVDKLASSSVYDIEMAEGTAGADALTELDQAALSLRHVRRIIDDRMRMLEDQP